MTDEEKAFMMQLEAKKRECDKMSLECEDIANQLRSESLRIEPLFHLDKSSIDFSKQRDPAPAWTLDGYSLIPNVNINALINSFPEAAKEIYQDPEFFSKSGFEDFQMCKVILHWFRAEPLIPPTIILFPKELKPFAKDGKHRIKAALNLGAITIPIIVPQEDEKEILKQINLAADL